MMLRRGRLLELFEMLNAVSLVWIHRFWMMARMEYPWIVYGIGRSMLDMGTALESSSHN